MSLRVITQDDADVIRDAEILRLDAIQVDDFTLAGYLKHSQ